MDVAQEHYGGCMTNVEQNDYELIDACMAEDEYLSVGQVLGRLYAMGLPEDTGVSVVRKGVVYGVTGFSHREEDLKWGVKLYAGPCTIQERKYLKDTIDYAMSIDPIRVPWGWVSVEMGDDDSSVDAYKVVKFPEGYHVAFYVNMDCDELEAMAKAIRALYAKQKAQQIVDDNTQLHADINTFLKGYGF
jgi:hypothetical protein